MNCLMGEIDSLGYYYGVPGIHEDGHLLGSSFKNDRPALFNSLATMCQDFSELAKISLDEAFAEGYVVANVDTNNLIGQILLRAISYLLTDPLVSGALGGGLA